MAGGGPVRQGAFFTQDPLNGSGCLFLPRGDIQGKSVAMQRADNNAHVANAGSVLLIAGQRQAGLCAGLEGPGAPGRGVIEQAQGVQLQSPIVRSRQFTAKADLVRQYQSGRKPR